MRGALPAISGAVSSIGSSPRMRGALDGALVLAQAGRIIPADAGSTPLSTPSKIQRTDHPRGCGEHQQQQRRPTGAGGSSPRMRGAQGSGFQVGDGRGIIPADAGSTSWKILKLYSNADHPRGCGEHRLLAVVYQRRSGSSPRMRGARQAHAHHPGHAGIIPADAGSTTPVVVCVQYWQDHPRGCGEHWHTVYWYSRFWGSSPRMRGAPRCPR